MSGFPICGLLSAERESEGNIEQKLIGIIIEFPIKIISMINDFRVK